ncbi:hypothetical protein ABKV19_005651 [Rosa sericea]
MVATSLDSKGSLMMNYSKAMTNFLELEGRECKIFHEVDARVMRYHPYLLFMRFDRIIYNFPHAGYMNGSSSSERNATQIWFHKNLVREFFTSAREILTTDGEIHVTHKTTYPFSEWKLVKIPEDVGLYTCIWLVRKGSHYLIIPAMKIREELGSVIKLFRWECLAPSDLPRTICTVKLHRCFQFDLGALDGNGNVWAGILPC